MSAITVMKFKVKSLSKFGFFAEGLEKGVYYSKKLDEKTKVQIVPGVEFEGELFTSDTGGMYLNKVNSFAVIKVTPKVESKQEIKSEVKVKPVYKAKEDTSMSKDEWAAKDTRISRQGLIQACVIALAPVVSLELLPEEAKKLATEMLKFVNEVK